jgi:hypothetical protein
MLASGDKDTTGVLMKLLINLLANLLITINAQKKVQKKCELSVKDKTERQKDLGQKDIKRFLDRKTERFI